MVTSNILQRTFYVKYEKYLGTAFTIELNDSQYLVSVNHTFPYLKSGEVINYAIFRNNKWEEMIGNIYTHDSKDVDIVLISLENDISPRHPIELSLKGVILS